MNFFTKLAKIFYRTETGSRVAGNSKNERRVLNFIFILVFFLLIPLIWNIIQNKNAIPILEIKSTDWNSYFSENMFDKCNLNDLNDQTCLAHPDNPTIWHSNIKRQSKEYLEKSQVNNTNFWVSTIISQDILNEARKNSANYLILQQIEGSYDVWMDGSLIGRGSYQNNDYPMLFPISMSRLTGPPLYLAVHIKNNIYTTNMESNNFTTNKDGFYSYRDFESVLRWQAASGQTGHLVLVALYLLLASLFYITIRYDEQRPEYGTATGFAACLALFHIMHVDAMYRFISAELWYSLFAGILAALVILILKYATSYSRSKSSIDNTLFYLLIGSFSFIFLFLSDSELTSDLIEVLSKFGIPASYLIGAFFLFIQSNHHRKNEAHRNSSRQNNLQFMCTIYFLAAVITFVQYQGVHDTTIEIPSGLWINMALLLFLAVKTGENIKSQLDLLNKAPISEFHKRTTLPTQVDGSILMIDLKNSEDIFRQGAEQKRGGSIMNLILSHIWSYFKQEGLIILQGEGDSILALWEKDKNDSVDRILKTILGLDKFMQNMSETLINSGVHIDNTLYFRATIVEGAVKPIWRVIDKDKIPAWIEAGEKNVFVDASRMLAIEKELVLNPNQSSLIVMGALADKYQEQMPQLTNRWPIHKVDCVSKHGKTYNISIFDPSDQHTTSKTQTAA